MKLKGNVCGRISTLALKKFVLQPLLLLIIICGLSAEKAKIQQPTHSLTLQRILSEFNEICSQGISFDTPFNSTRDEVLKNITEQFYTLKYNHYYCYYCYCYHY